ncbi:hypothetical protein AVEN_122201-1 [Araneus ventricosus]|uniref:Uncharacterized protein n=1 Tax=Araneus ventricosus TaxID=182803 RepID=A0A4Y2IKY1_ARAVE|nr:hypothetical protein AVEN_122201-1 [Araneus ventricosus]
MRLPGRRSLKRGEQCYSHGKSLPSSAGLMVGKRVYKVKQNLSDSRGTHDGDKLGSILAANRLFRKCNPFSIFLWGRDPGFHENSM